MIPFANFDEWSSEADTRHMQTFDTWDIIQGSIPQHGSPVRERRPALVVASGAFKSAMACCG